ncbi:MAG: response regulator [Dehalococcoidia bacterium]|nr:response regulator [Dehalococcoidia bacterium]
MARILVVEDEAMVAEVVEQCLRHDSHTVRVVHDGPSALRAHREQPADLLVLDVMLPGLDGFEVCRRVREDGDIPIIIVSARREEQDRLHGLGLGADDYVTKPFSPRELAARVQAVLRRATPAVQRHTLWPRAGCTWTLPPGQRPGSARRSS